MGTTAAVRNKRILPRRRVIQRPRLLALLDESDACVKTLVAPAGYGKTTLAEQWVAQEGRRSAWYTARSSSVDVAALALGIARASTGVVVGCDARLRQHLRAVSSAAGNVPVLVEILGEDLAEWPLAAWLVLDDYQELTSSAEAEAFVSDLVASSPIQVLIGTRQRPSWVTTRSILYGEVLELNQTALAMDAREAEDVLQGWTGRSASGLVAVANGWPAVIGLASVTSAEIEDEHALPESLYQFFAEEVFDALGEDVRAGLAELAIGPVIDWELARAVLGPDRAETVCAAALEVGILVERDGRLDLHPLARSFLEERRPMEGLAPPDDDSTAVIFLTHYRRNRDWDAAFDFIGRTGTTNELDSLMADALDDLLETARLSTIETWCDRAVAGGDEALIFALARAEVALRQGRHGHAMVFAEAASREGALAFRALGIAARAAHLDSREEESLDLYRRAEEVADTPGRRRDSLWGQLICAIELELPEAATALAELKASVPLSNPRELVRAATCDLSYHLRFGTIDLSQSDAVLGLVHSARDPLIESAFYAGYSYALAMSARYNDALECATALLEIIRRYRLDFAIPYALCPAAIAHAGKREWRNAEECLDRAEASARPNNNAHAAQSCLAIRYRVATQAGRPHAALAACAIESPALLPSTRAEVIGSRALVLSSLGRIDEAATLLEQVEGSSRSVEPTLLIPATRAAIQVKRAAADSIADVLDFEEIAFGTGALDFLVVAYRSVPELLAILLRASPQPERLVSLIRSVRDEDLARAAGVPVDTAQTARELLSPREGQVYELLCQGLTNRQIAKLLFIEESTVKAHTHHIYDKLGIRSRTALAVQAALERSD
jgi:ATP/maltotriose-dependent transcriptional regulator MalT